ncbi:hypothetical protein PsYK624_105360 [Phanerochaete sordida]|uniref:F-box domain-containing protein n=1 Tax=Phanerochaete sordida TaxID=48140 RepID=A0A9P3GGA2_9APHY|nr:hypothetical protein PsYK624_105360 [Phanerochaete sordida]
MSALWRNIGSLSPVLDGLFEKHPAAADTSDTELKISLNACTRFLNNARRVEALHLWNAPETEPQLQVLKLHYPSIELLFPNLRVLSLGSISPGIGLFLPWFISPALAILHTSPWVDLVVLVIILSRVTQVSPKLQEFDYGDRKVHAHISTLLSVFSHLERFRCGDGLTDKALLHVSRLPSLRSLEIGNVSMDAIRLLRSHAFASLVNLKISPKRGDLECILSLVSSVTSPLLNQIALDIPSSVATWVSTTDVQNINQALCKHSYLTDISIRAYTETIFEGEPVPISALFSLRRLQSFDLRLPGFSVKDADIPFIAAAWPDLHTFRMLTGQYNTPLSTTEFTPTALALFARHIPRLRALAVDMDTSELHELNLPHHRSLAPITLTLDHILLEDKHVLPMAVHIATAYPEAIVDTALIDELMQDDLELAAHGEQADFPVPDFWSRICREYLPLLKRFQRHGMAMALEATDA